MTYIRKATVFLLALVYCVYATAETKVTGYASIVAGKTAGDSQFLADYPKAGIYENEISFKPDTSAGIQISAELGPGLDFITQLASHGARDFATEAGWAYLSYEIRPELIFHLGRKALPLYYYSDSFDIGYTYHWIRPPADNYTWQISHYNGASISYIPQLTNWDASIMVYGGREDSEDNDLLSLLSGASVDETWKNMIGLVVESSYNWLDVRLSYLHGLVDRDVNNIPTKRNVAQDFYGASVNLDFNPFKVFSEYNEYRRDLDSNFINTGMYSISYRIGDFTPHVTRSRFTQHVRGKSGDEAHNTTSVGVRWDVANSLALKIQYDKVEDEGVNIPVLGNSSVYSVAVDLVF
ncbi:MAG: porin [Gammaproteobacteria bacterium]|nr:porin [Gammaproteobacteria bacterium]